MDERFADRAQAGQLLAKRCESLRASGDLLVLALPRGGVPVAAPLARALGAPLDVLVVRKLGHPGQEEFAMGAIAPGGVRVMAQAGGQWPVSTRELEAVLKREEAELARRERAYRGERPALRLQGRHVVLVDDGLATGATMQAAVRAARAGGAQRITVAVPVASQEALAAVSALADEVICLSTPEPFHAVGLWYRDFDQTSDEEVLRLLG
ncbi:phosphoribosyltransferase [Variovorax dokdonensis]|uniref:Phosphoribosyltransferase n=1 Tax=Variovorax dokdonensis TaxID=344883 RepID=A0ABT7NBQ0_9BURK|nr:phosphoribosyltransferase [Variovorax dokdonensis]MDM0045376.1 phosphoribosyltransferase [Variovorax dokdonensis]